MRAYTSVIKVTNMTGSRGGGRGEGGEGGEELGNKVTLEKFGQSFRWLQTILRDCEGLVNVFLLN